MNVSTPDHSNGTRTQRNPVSVGNDLARLTHGLMGTISALLMCEHMISRELADTEELAGNPTLQTTLSLLKETVDQIHQYGDDLMQVSQCYKQSPPEA